MVALDKMIVSFIFLYVLFSPLSLAAANTSLVIALLCWVVKAAVKRGVSIERTSLNIPLLVFIGVVGISVLSSTDMLWSLRKYDAMWMVVVFFLVVNNIRAKQQLKRIVVILIAVTVIAGISGIIEHFIGVNLIQGSGMRPYPWLLEVPPRSSSFFTHPVKFGMYLMMAIPVIFALLIYSGKVKLRLLLLVSFGIASLALVYTYSRGCWITLLLAMLFINLLVFKLKKFIIISAAFVTLVVMFMTLFPGSNISRRASTIVDLKFNTSNLMRLEAWNRSLWMLKERPMLGVGWGRIERENAKWVKKGERTFNHAHNTYLNFAVETGLVGLGVLVWLFIIIIRSGFWIFRNTEDKYLKAVAGGVLSSLLAFMLSGMVDSPYSVPAVVLLFYFLTGILFAIPQIEKTLNEERRLLING